MRSRPPAVLAAELVAATQPHLTGSFLPFPRVALDASIPLRFQEQVRRHGDRPAFRGEGHASTYRDFGAAVDRLARVLLERRGPAWEPVALLGHGAGIVTAMLAVLRAGKAYVPLDPDHPRERLDLIVGHCGPSLLLTDAGHVSLARSLAGGAEVVTLEEADAVSPRADLAAAPSGDTVAAIIYTSGSTGRPKGVVQTQRSILHRVLVATNHYLLGPDDHLSLLQSPSFSASLRPVFTALLNGAVLCHFDVRARGLAPVPRWLEREGITVHMSSTTVFRHVTEAVTDPALLRHIRLVYLGGEPVTRAEVERFRSLCRDDGVLVNSLASNEAGTICEYAVTKATGVTEERVPVGFPVDDKEIFLLDEGGAPTAPGGVGEIVVRSRYLSPGYWREPELTARVFAPDPAGGGLGLYRTGDMGRMRSDGCFEQIGRKDFQAKIRGQRVQPEEVEAALRDHPGVRDAAVAPRDRGAGDTRLVGYVVPSAPGGLAPGEVREFLRRRLPAHMVPTTFVVLEALPRTPNGKVDRLALPEPDFTRTGSAAGYVAPSTPLEVRLAGIWREVLGVDRVGTNDHFLDLGGNSLIAMQVVSRVQGALQVPVSPRALLEAPTVADMALVVLQTLAEDVGSEALARLVAEPSHEPGPSATGPSATGPSAAPDAAR